MTLTDKQWTLVSIISAALLITLAIFGGGYRAFGILFLPLGVWVGLRHEPEQKQVRPAIRALGWIFVCIAVLAVIGAVISILAGR
jgi:hypothetical protein